MTSPDVRRPQAPDGRRLALVTGATGYIGGRLVPELLSAGFAVRAMARDPRRVSGRSWAASVEVVQGDATEADQVRAAMRGVDVAYYLVHALGTGARFDDLDRRAATVFAAEAATAGAGRVVYLGGLHPESEELSPHLRSRKEVGDILLAGPVPAAVLQAAVIIGSGSASFEMLRYLTERLPVMTTPRWVDTRIQPIAVRDVLRYLVGAASLPPELNRTFDIGGPDVVTYRRMMQCYAEVAGLPPRRIVPVPVLSPSLSSHWVGLVTPVPSSIARPLVDSLVHEVVVKERDLARWVPDPPDGLIGLERALRLALARVQGLDVVTSWTSASTPGAPSDPLPDDPDWAGGSLYVDERRSPVDASPGELWRVIEGVGGETGWYSWPLGWQLRGLLDRVVGGPGLVRGRRDARRLAVGDAVDWWRVEHLEPGRLLRLRAEMRLPGLAWLELAVEEDQEAGTVFRQRALFHPRGLLGHAYWAVIAPFHGIVFGGMQRNIARAATESGASRTFYPLRFSRAYRLAGLPFGVRPSTCRVTLDARTLSIRFGPWRLETPRHNVAGTSVTGPYAFGRTAGPAHLSLTDRGVTFATNAEQGLCIHFHEPVRALNPRGRPLHPAATVTVADVEGLRAELARHPVLP